MSHAVVLVSGGIDSAVCLGMAVDEHLRITPVHYQYGQQTADVECERAEKLVDYYQTLTENQETSVYDLTVIDYESVFSNFAQGVADDEKTFEDELEDDGRSSGYVPMRNLHLIASGAGIADDRGASEVWIGVQAGDEEAYPDCRADFMSAAKLAVWRSVPADANQIEIQYPLVNKPKTLVIREGESLGVPWSYTYSCYETTELEDPQPCGQCPACIERAEAFSDAGIEDPVGTPEAREEVLAGD